MRKRVIISLKSKSLARTNRLNKPENKGSHWHYFVGNASLLFIPATPIAFVRDCMRQGKTQKNRAFYRSISVIIEHECMLRVSLKIYCLERIDRLNKRSNKKPERPYASMQNRVITTHVCIPNDIR